MTSSSLRRIGLTGGIGSGKSTLAQMLQERGFPLVDADAISRHLTQAGGAAIEALRQVFGRECIDANGAMDRVHMRHLVFTQPNAKRLLESVLHPLIFLQIEKEEQTLMQNGNSLVVMDIPLLIESSHWRARLDRVLVIDCEEKTQLDRVVQRSQLSEETVRQIMANQASRSQRLAGADMVIYNNENNLAYLRQQALALNLNI